MSERTLICQNMLNTGQNEVKTFGGSRFKKNRTLSTRAYYLTLVCMNKGDNVKLMSSDNEKAQFTIFHNKFALYTFTKFHFVFYF